VEWSLNIESEVFVEFSLLWLTLELVDIDDVPKLVDLSIGSAYNNVLILLISVVLDFQ
jgi:hypothetical protein